MKTFHELPTGLIHQGRGDRLPPAGGMLIALGASLMLWGGLVALVL